VTAGDEAAPVAAAGRIPGATHPVRRLLPELGETTVAEQLAGLELNELAPPERPYLVLNFATTLDGRAAISGRSGPIGSDADTEMLQRLRTRVDAVMIGAGTMRAERYGRVVGDPAKRERREREGLPADPLMVIVSGALHLPWDAPLFTEGAGRVLIATTSDAEPPETKTPVHLLRQEDKLDLASLLAHLREEWSVRAVLCEGGPHLHAQLIDAGLVDELFVTHAPKLAGGAGPGLVAGLAEREREVEVAWLLAEERTGELFGRYRMLR
jgi:riboflavin-specific deaminase-like protein